MYVSPLEQLGESYYRFDNIHGSRVIVHGNRDGSSYDISGLVKNPEEYEADFTEAHHLVDFGDKFAGLRGVHNLPEKYLKNGKPDTDKLEELGIFVLSFYSSDASKLVSDIDQVAGAIVHEGYPTAACNELADMLQVADDMVAKEWPVVGWDRDTATLTDNQLWFPALERGGLPALRRVLGLDMDALVDHEMRIVAKRVYMTGSNENDGTLAATIQWRDVEQARQLRGGKLVVCDNVVASNSSISALLASIRMLNGDDEANMPNGLEYRSVLSTWAGLREADRTTECFVGIRKLASYSLGLAFHLNGKFYLADNRISDAGHALVVAKRLPSWYQR